MERGVTAEMKRLLEPGVLGFYAHFEPTEILGYKDGESQPRNVFSLFVAEAFDGPAPSQEKKVINEKDCGGPPRSRAGGLG